MPSALEYLARSLDQDRQPRAVSPRSMAAPVPVPIPEEEAPETEVLDPRNQSAFLSGLKYLGRFGQVPKNLLAGNLEGAGRQALDIVGDTVDSIVPFVDLIPEFSRPQDEIEGSDLLGIDREVDPGLATLASLGVDLVTDPLTYLGVGAAGKAAKGAAALAGGEKARKALTLGVPFSETLRAEIPGSARALEALGRGAGAAFDALPEGAQKGLRATQDLIERTFGAVPVDPKYAQIIREGQNIGEGVSSAEVAALKEFIRNRQMSAEGGDALGRAVQDVMQVEGKNVPILGQAAMPQAASVSMADDLARIIQPVQREAGPLAKNVLKQVGKEGKDLYESGIDIANREMGLDVLARAMKGGAPIGGAPSGVRQLINETVDPFARNYKPGALDQMLGAAPDLSQASRGRPLVNPLDAAVTQQGGPMAELAYQGLKDVPKADEVFSVAERSGMYRQALQKMLDAGAITPKAFDEAVQSVDDFVRLQQQSYKNAVTTGALGRIPGVDIERQAPSYLSRSYTGLEDEDALKFLAEASGQSIPNALKERSLRSGEAVADMLNRNPKAALVTDARKAALDRAKRTGQMAQSASVSKALAKEALASAEKRQAELAEILSPHVDRFRAVQDDAGRIFNTADEARAAGVIDPKPLFTPAQAAALEIKQSALTDSAFRKTVAERIQEIAKTDVKTARELQRAISGNMPRSEFMAKLAAGNRYFKKFAVYGAVVPKIGSLVRNVIGGVWQTLSNEEARGTLGRGTLGNAVQSILRSVDDGIESALGRRLGTTNDLAVIERALAQSGGDFNKALQLVPDETMRDAMRHGVFSDNFVDTEQLINVAINSGWRKTFTNLMDMPGVMFRGTEQRMRYGLFKALKAQGKSGDEAAKIVEDTFYNYRMGDAANRNARDLIPFFQFSAKAIPQQAKFLAEQPSVAVGLESLLRERQGDPRPTWMEGKLSIPLGKNAAGENQYLAGAGLPVEALGLIPNPAGSFQQFGRDVGRSIVGSSQPILKTGLSAAFGVDPYFGSSFGSYSKLPGNIEGGAAGRAINILRGTGITQPLESLATLAGTVADDRKTAGVKALDLLTGAKVVSSDPDRALQQRLTEYLKRNPNIASIQSLYAKSDDPEAVALIRELNSVKARIRTKKKAAEGLNALAP